MATASAKTEETSGVSAKNDLLTIGAMAIVAYLISAFTHEGLGHGVASLIVGAPIQHVTSLDLASDLSKVSPWAGRFVDAAGCLAQFILAVIMYLVYRRTPTANANWRFFTWLLYFINVLIPAGYMMALSFANFGDWNAFVQGLSNDALWRTGFTVVGAGITLFAMFTGARQLNEFLGRGRPQRFTRAMQLTATAYLVGSAANTLAGILNPDGVILVLISAGAATFGGTICLFWTGFIAASRPPDVEPPAIPLAVTRQVGWLIAGAGALVIYFAVLGPGIPR
jgi:hypothetical protein